MEQNYIPTPEASKATGVHYDELYPKVFKDPATYIKFSSTVEDCNPISYCMDDEDVKFLAQLNEGKDADGQERKGAEKLSQCNEDVFEEVMNFFEESSARLQPFANVDNAPILTLEEMEQSLQDEQTISAEAQKWLKPIYKHWVVQKGSRPLMPSIKVRVLDTTNEADDADPYVCFRRREVRQTRKTRGRDAQVAEKLKKLRLELEDGRQLLLMVNQREKLKSQQAQLERKKFRERHQLRKVKVDKQIVGEKGDDEELLVDQKVRARILVVAFALMLTFLYYSLSPSPANVNQKLPAIGLQQYACVLSASVQHPSPMHPTTISLCSKTMSRKVQLLSKTPSKPGRNSTRSGTNTGWTKPSCHLHHRSRKRIQC